MFRLLPILVLLTLSACTYMVPRKDLPNPIVNDTFAEKVKTVAIPLPVIATSPNEGITYGGLVAFLFHNAKDEASTLIVPQVNFNDHFGVSSTLYGAFYPTPQRNLKVNLSKSTRINKDYRMRYADETFLSPRWETDVSLYDFADGSARFFGFQYDSPKQNETNYADREKGVELNVGYRLEGPLELVFGERFKRVDITRGAIEKVPFMNDLFPAGSVPGAGGFTVHAQKLSLVFDAMDSRNLPTSGVYARASVDNSFAFLGSSATYQRFEAEFKDYLCLDQGRYITVARVSLSQTSGEEIPFLEQSILGGETTLRGYGQNRFVDRSFILLNLEERIRLFRWEVFNVMADWEIAPFVDLGTVTKNLLKSKAATFEFNPGVGLRAVVRPNIIGRIDVGFGEEGPAVFVGLGYPF